jgi:hypothetical protein
MLYFSSPLSKCPRPAYLAPMRTTVLSVGFALAITPGIACAQTTGLEAYNAYVAGLRDLGLQLRTVRSTMTALQIHSRSRAPVSVSKALSQIFLPRDLTVMTLTQTPPKTRTFPTTCPYHRAR